MKTAKIPLPGFRTIKSAIAILACLLFYWVIDRDNVLLALFATFICIQDSIWRSVQNGVDRIIGTVAGGVFGLLLLLTLGGFREQVLLWYTIVSVGVIVLIYSLNILKRNDSITMGAIVFLIIVLDSSLDSPLRYATDYVIDTVIGIVVAVAVNRLPLGCMNDRTGFRNAGGSLAELTYRTVGNESHTVSKWSGGQTTELLISPDDAHFADRRFDWRISTATTDAAESEFSDFSGFMRHIMVLDGNLTLVHDGHHSVSLSPGGQDSFDGSWHTKGYGVCRDFNLILSGGYDGKLIACENNATYFLKDITQNQLLNYCCAIYCPDGQISVAAFCDEKPVMRSDLNAGEVILFEKLDRTPGALKFIPFAKGPEAPKTVCIAAYIAKKG